MAPFTFLVMPLSQDFVSLLWCCILLINLAGVLFFRLVTETACRTRVDNRTVSEVIKVVLGLEEKDVILYIIICYSG